MDGKDRAPTPDGTGALRAGMELERYRVERVIGAGGFGITYLARHTTLGKPFALKEHFPRQFSYREGGSSTIRATEPETFSWSLGRFIEEGRALARLTHPGIVSVADVFEANGTAYMVLGYEEGQSLKSWLERQGRRPTQAEIDGLLGPLLDALAYVHGQGLLHRDIAPDNIMIRPDGAPCLIDFGAARQAIAERSQVMSAIVKGGFSPPEQYSRSGRAQGAWSDIYALGATLYLAVSGQMPPEALDRMAEDELRSLHALARRDSYRPGFLNAVDAALRLKPAERPQTISDWRKMLFEPAAEPVAATKLTSGATAAQQPSDARLLTFTALPGAPVERRTQSYLPLILAGLGVVGVGYLVWQGPPVPPIERAAVSGGSLPGTAVPPAGVPKAQLPDPDEHRARADQISREAEEVRRQAEERRLEAEDEERRRAQTGELRKRAEEDELRRRAAEDEARRRAAEEARQPRTSDAEARARAELEIAGASAEARGDVAAIVQVGWRFDTGTGVARDYVRAREWYEKAAARNSPEAMYNLGVLYSNGRGVAVDHGKAREWYERGAARGNADAMWGIGSIHDLGLGVPQSFATARRWYEQAAEKSQVDAMLNLAILYENGRGVQASCRTALQWYRRSAERGSEKAKAYLPVIERSCR
jgi:hypothetical protein